MNIATFLPPLLLSFAITLLASFVLGLELHTYRRSTGEDLGFGSTRTLSLAGISGFVLTVLDPSMKLYLAGIFFLALFLGVNYRSRQSTFPSLIPPLLILLTYTTGPVTLKEPLWFLAVYLVVILFVLGESPGIRKFSDAISSTEAITLAKFLTLAGIILPLLPDRIIDPRIPVTYPQVFLAVIMVSGVSYLSYLARTYFFPGRGMLLTGILGGLYSSTVATIVIARSVRGKPRGRELSQASTAIILASAMMYLRLEILVIILGHRKVALDLLLPYALLFLLALASAWAVNRLAPASGDRSGEAPLTDAPGHPLELRTAIFFSLAFLFFAGLTREILVTEGPQGLHVLSFFVGFTDITPFILSLLDGSFHVSRGIIEEAILIASGTNNLLNGLYALGLSRNRGLAPAAAWLAAAFVLSLFAGLVI